MTFPRIKSVWGQVVRRPCLFFFFFYLFLFSSWFSSTVRRSSRFFETMHFWWVETRVDIIYVFSPSIIYSLEFFERNFFLKISPLRMYHFFGSICKLVTFYAKNTGRNISYWHDISFRYYCTNTYIVHTTTQTIDRIEVRLETLENIFLVNFNLMIFLSKNQWKMSKKFSKHWVEMYLHTKLFTAKMSWDVLTTHEIGEYVFFLN